MNTIIRRLACTVAALTLAAPTLAQSDTARTAEAAARAAERAAAHAARLAERTATHVAKSAEWSAKTWTESWQAKKGPETTERLVKTFKVGQNGFLDLHAISGDVMVNEGGGDTITVEAIKSVRGKDPAEAKDQLARANVVMNQVGNRVEVRIQYTGRNNQAGVDFNVTAPAGTSVNARSISGDVQVKNIKGDTRIESISGSVSAVGTPNLSLLKTVSGDLELANLAVNGDLSVNTISGTLQLRSVKARSLNAESVSGDLDLIDVTTERVSVKTVNGDIQYSGPLARNGRYEMKTHSGDITITMPHDVGFELEASTFSGEVRSDLPVTTRAGASVMGPGPNKGLRGTHGDGAALLMLSTFNGDVVVTKK